MRPGHQQLTFPQTFNKGDQVPTLSPGPERGHTERAFIPQPCGAHSSGRVGLALG